MPKSRPPYPTEFGRKIVALVRAGRTPDELSQQFEPSARTIRNWLAQTDRDEGKRADGVSSAEREELSKLRREVRQLKLEREEFGGWASEEMVRRYAHVSPAHLCPYADRLRGVGVVNENADGTNTAQP